MSKYGWTWRIQNNVQELPRDQHSKAGHVLDWAKIWGTRTSLSNTSLVSFVVYGHLVELKLNFTQILTIYKVP